MPERGSDCFCVGKGGSRRRGEEEKRRWDTRCMCFSESVLSTGLIVNKCLVLEQQAPLSSVASCCWRFTNYVCQKGHSWSSRTCVCCWEQRINIIVLLLNAKVQIYTFCLNYSVYRPMLKIFFLFYCAILSFSLKSIQVIPVIYLYTKE